jgi:hypothetical protein
MLSNVNHMSLANIVLYPYIFLFNLKDQYILTTIVFIICMKIIIYKADLYLKHLNI